MDKKVSGFVGNFGKGDRLRDRMSPEPSGCFNRSDRSGTRFIESCGSEQVCYLARQRPTELPPQREAHAARIRKELLLQGEIVAIEMILRRRRATVRSTASTDRFVTMLSALETSPTAAKPLM